MSILEQITDRYQRVARLLPGLIVVLPVSVQVVSSIPLVLNLWGKLGALLVASGLPFAVAQAVRDRGRRLENELFAAWGGRPTEAMLSWSGSSTKASIRRRHALIEQHLGIALPDQAAENNDPDGALAMYEVAVGALRERTRDRAMFPLLFHELINYGFRRNLLSLRSAGVTLTLLSAIATVTLSWTGLVPLGWKQQSALVAFDCLWIAGWLRIVTSEWVRGAAETYARQLLDSLETIGGPALPAETSQ